MTTPTTRRPRELTGRHVLVIALAAFGIIITANMALVFAATSSFPDLVVKNSYVAGVGWNDRAERQRALGWRAEARHADGVLAVAMTGADGAAVGDLHLVATVGRPATSAADRTLVLLPENGVYAAPAALGPGLWRIAIEAEGAAGSYRAETEIFVRGDPS